MIKPASAACNSRAARPFPRPETGFIAVKAINHLGDEVMKVYAVGKPGAPRQAGKPG